MHHLLGLPVFEAYEDGTRDRAPPPPMRAEWLRKKFKSTAVIVIDEISMVSPADRTPQAVPGAHLHYIPSPLELRS